MNTVEIDKEDIENWQAEQNLFELKNRFSNARRIINAGGTCNIIRQDKVMNLTFSVHEFSNLEDFDKYYKDLTKYL
ncbi:hypothetical protein [Polluticaenibacter yanchengensis]|uniref:Uncharacterized protein n=1 Tax=Polluticaenibacter yanchengensis TaxID=3014562 RepID=A0ABT4UKB4_9BACT|nr:hypothetical protein [Chitinophagaceae bacterium LY-5]